MNITKIVVSVNSLQGSLLLAIADFLLLFYTYNMFSKHHLITLLVTAVISLPLCASVNQKSCVEDNQFIKTSDYSENDKIYMIFYSKERAERRNAKAAQRQKELDEKRQKALAEIEARKAGNASTDEIELSETEEIAENQEVVETTENEIIDEEAQRLARLQAEKEAESAKAEAEKAAALEAAEAQKKEQERLQAQIAKELENQKTAASKNKKEYLSDYMVYEYETVNDSDDSEESYKRIANPDERDAAGKTLLMRAAKDGNEWELKQLIDSEADVNLTDSDGWTALMYAVRYSGSLECVEKLLEAGADVTAQNTYGFSALVLAACYNGNPQILTKLLDNYKASDREVLRALVFLLSEQNISERQQLSKLQIFMDKAVPLNILYEGKTPLMYASKYGNSTKVLQVLLDNQSSVTLRSTEGKTAFDYAINNNNLAHDTTYWALNKK